MKNRVCDFSREKMKQNKFGHHIFHVNLLGGGGAFPGWGGRNMIGRLLSEGGGGGGGGGLCFQTLNTRSGPYFLSRYLEP